MYQDDILRLDVPMKDLMFMHKSNRIKQIPNDKGGSFLGKCLATRDDIEELSIAS